MWSSLADRVRRSVGPFTGLVALGLLASLGVAAHAADPETPPAPPAEQAAPPPVAPAQDSSSQAGGTGAVSKPESGDFGVPIKATVPIVYLGKEYEEPLPLSYSEKIITDKGIQGARLIAKDRPAVPILAVTPAPSVWRQMALLWGVTPIQCPFAEDTDGLLRLVEQELVARGHLAAGDLVVVMGGMPVAARGLTNFIKIHRVGAGEIP